MSTAKELRHDAEWILSQYEALDRIGRRTIGITLGARLAQHILATVREDDDEPATVDWLYSVLADDFNFGHPLNEPAYFEHRLSSFSTHTLPPNPTRGQMRHLFAALGIELKEPA